MAAIHHTLLDRCVALQSGCIEWTRAKNNMGYGMLRIHNKGKLAHRISYERSVGPIPEGMNVLHSCDNPACLNPDHLFLGTQRDNIQDCVRKGRWRGGAPGEKHGNCKLTQEQVLKIRVDKRAAKIVADEYRIFLSTVYKIRHRISWKHI
jgi:hypothetical protein